MKFEHWSVKNIMVKLYIIIWTKVMYSGREKMLKTIVSYIIIASLLCIYFLSFDETDSKYIKYMLLMAFTIFALNIILKRNKD